MHTLSKIVSNIATVLMCGALFGYGELGDAPIKILMGAGIHLVSLGIIIEWRKQSMEDWKIKQRIRERRELERQERIKEKQNVKPQNKS